MTVASVIKLACCYRCIALTMADALPRSKHKITLPPQHVSIAQLGKAQLVLPPFHQPSEHRKAGATAGSDAPLNASDVLNVSSILSPCTSVRASPSDGFLAYERLATVARLTYATCDSSGGGADCAGGARWHALQLPRHEQPALAVVHLLRGGAGLVAYCHTVECRARTRRVCRRRRRQSPCTRPPPRLPDNYLFAHRLARLLCGGTSPPVTPLERLQLATLRKMEVAAPLAATAARLSARLGQYAALHLRASDGNGARATKGLNQTDFLHLLSRAAPMLRRLARASAGARTTLYLASNRPEMVADLLPASQRVLGQTFFRLSSWSDLAPAFQTEPQPSGLRAALVCRPLPARHPTQSSPPPRPRLPQVEHELCVRAPLGFAGSSWSTWSNLIGARRWARGVPAESAYLDLATAAPTPACAEVALPPLLSRVREASIGASGGCDTWLEALGLTSEGR